MTEVCVNRDVTLDPAIEVLCGACGKCMMLWWNGGELDQRECCGVLYQLRHTKVELWEVRK